MKTIRQNTFETNSSSTHAVSFSSTLSSPPTIRPYSESDIVLYPTQLTEEETWRNKINLLALVAYCDEEASKITTIPHLESVLSKFVGSKITLDFSEFEENMQKDVANPRWKTTEYEYKKNILDNGYFSNSEYGFNSEDGFLSTVREILSNDDKIIRFCFTESIYNVEEYYDG